MKMQLLLTWIFIVIFALVTAPLTMALFAKSLGNPNSLFELIKEAVTIELRLFGIIK